MHCAFCSFGLIKSFLFDHLTSWHLHSSRLLSPQPSLQEDDRSLPRYGDSLPRPKEPRADNSALCDLSVRPFLSKTKRKKQKGCGQYRRRQFSSLMNLQKKIQLIANSLSLSLQTEQKEKWVYALCEELRNIFTCCRTLCRITTRGISSTVTPSSFIMVPSLNRFTWLSVFTVFLICSTQFSIIQRLEGTTSLPSICHVDGDTYTVIKNSNENKPEKFYSLRLNVLTYVPYDGIC